MMVPAPLLPLWRRVAWLLRAAVTIVLTPVYLMSLAVGALFVVGRPADDVLAVLLGGSGVAATIWFVAGVLTCFAVVGLGWCRVVLDARRVWQSWVGPWPRE